MSGRSIRGAHDVFRVLHDITRKDREHFFALHLDPHLRLIRRELVAIGTLTHALLHPREVFRGAIRHGAYALILAHNHPTGDPTPSEEDIEVTRQLCIVADAVEIPILSHVILARDAYAELAPRSLHITPWQEQEVALTARTTSPPCTLPRSPRTAEDWQSWILALRGPALPSWIGCDQIAQPDFIPQR
jgi:hypothetical protein